jgi:hypothetical protein
MLLGVLYFCTGLGLGIIRRILKKKRFGRLTAIGRLKVKQFPTGPLIELILFILYNSVYVITKISKINSIFISLYLGSTLLTSIMLVIEMINKKSFVYIYENGIEVNQYEMLIKDLRKYQKNGKGEYKIENEQGNEIEFYVIKEKEIVTNNKEKT